MKVKVLFLCFLSLKTYNSLLKKWELSLNHKSKTNQLKKEDYYV